MRILVVSNFVSSSCTSASKFVDLVHILNKSLVTFYVCQFAGLFAVMTVSVLKGLARTSMPVFLLKPSGLVNKRDWLNFR